MSALRRQLEHTPGSAGIVLLRLGGGYVLEIEPDQVDLHLARRYAGEAGRVGDGQPDRDEQAVELLRQACSLWRGTPLGGLECDWAGAVRAGLEQERLALVEQRYKVELRLGNHRAAVGPLAALLVENPLAEPLAGLYMLALYRCGRQADALAAYAKTRQRLIDQLGDEPGVELRQLHEQVLRRDPVLDPARRSATSAAGATVAPQQVTPAQLPPAVSPFVGREKQLAWLDALARGEAGRSAAVVISAIVGTAGIGKTALAVHWGHRVAEAFPDGQLYVNLRGYDPEQPMTAGDALAGFLTALGVPGPDIPLEVDERAARYRTQIAGRRMLVVLDNAATAEQVRPLLPGASSCAVVVTSRDSLAGLVAVHGAHRLDLDLLSPADAVVLLRTLIGPRADADPDAATTLAELCARLPLALRVAAELAISHPNTPLADLVAGLANQHRRLNLLNASGDPRATVTTVFSWSIRHLPPDAARTFSLLGLHPGPDIDPYAAAALTDANLVEDARHRLELLARAHLLYHTGVDRYGMHDLLRAYAAELTRGHDTDHTRRAAVGRLLDHYRHTAAVAMDTAYPYNRQRRPYVPPADTPNPAIHDPTHASAWLDTELPNLLAAALHAARHGWPHHTMHLSAILHWHLRTRSRYTDAETLHHQALTTAQTTGNRTGEQDALINLGHIYRLRGRYQQAADHFQQALDIANTTGNHTRQLYALRGLGELHLLHARYEEAADHYQQALDIAHTTGNHGSDTLDALRGLGNTHLAQGRYEQAADHFQRALDIARTTGNHAGQLYALRGLGTVHKLGGRYEQAADHFQRALDIARTTGNHAGQLSALCALGEAHRLQGRYEQAADALRQSLTISQEIDDQNWQFEALQSLGRLHHTTGHPADALVHHQQALTLATDLQQPSDQARAHDGLAHAHRSLNQPEQAHHHWQQALAILLALDTDHTEEAEVTVPAIRGQIAELDPAGDVLLDLGTLLPNS